MINRNNENNETNKRPLSPSSEIEHHNPPPIRKRNPTEMSTIHRDISTMPQDQQHALLANIPPLPQIYLNQEDVSTLGELNNSTNNPFRADNFFEDTVAGEPNDNDSMGTIDDTSNLTSDPDNEGQTVTSRTLKLRKNRVPDPDNEGQTIRLDILLQRQNRRKNSVDNRASVAQPLNSDESSPIGGFKDDGNCFNPQP